MGHWHYAAILAACLAVTAPLELVGDGVYRHPRRTVTAIAPIAAGFVAWDVLATAHGIWRFDPRFLLGVTVPGGLPIEEVLFFLVIPVCGLLTFNAVGAMVTRLRRDRRPV
ncbi:lycopene cyclase domain-containing protein [Nocardia sp. alder85J]|uniref:lycopene cyclase domain-containing protein n=1 Tax=Nocardia sp. alder85J TaxID=2862949 RepID=UPI001CD41EAA|nr:lycopene cyclase domain-containing protein [Nocardia sp. alder85J]MCX4094716.1 lycopene cyclase domain-containing protein [Nocardia sp. alder85J]